MSMRYGGPRRRPGYIPPDARYVRHEWPAEHHPRGGRVRRAVGFILLAVAACVGSVMLIMALVVRT